MAKPTAEDPMVAKVFDKAKHEEVARAIQELSPEEANFFLVRLEAAIKKRKIQITGYLVAMGVWVLGMLLALVYFGIATGFVGWVFLAPFGAVGVVLWIFGKWGERIGRAGELAASPAGPPAKPASQEKR